MKRSAFLQVASGQRPRPHGQASCLALPFLVAVTALLLAHPHAASGATITVGYDNNYTLGNNENAPLANLTTTGTLDWAHWTAGGNTTANNSKSVDYTGLIGSVHAIQLALTEHDPSNVGAISAETTGGWRFAFSDGTAPASGPVQGAIRTQSPDNGDGAAPNVGWLLSVYADSTERTLRLFVGGYEAGGELFASLGDGSAGNVTFSSNATAGRNTNQNGAANWSYTITFASDTPTQLNLRWRQDYDDGNFDNVWLSGAALSGPTFVPEPSTAVLLGLAAFGCALRRRRPLS